MLFALLALVWLASVTLAIHVAHPVEDQLPLVARAGQPYAWTIRADTFTPRPATVVARNLPKWLTFDGASTTFAGTVPAELNDDIWLPPITLVATAANGDTASDRFQLLATSRAAPSIAHSLASQLRPNAPPLASVFLLNPGSALATLNPDGSGYENGLRVPPGWSFSIGWRDDTFVFDDGHSVQYAARLKNGDALPSWIKYRTDTLTFSGVAPNVDVPTKLDIVLYGGDVLGYSAVKEEFQLTVAAHELSVELAGQGAAGMRVNVSAESPFSTALALPRVLLDGKPLEKDDPIAVNITNKPDWIAYDPTSNTLHGTPPFGYTGTSNVTMSASSHGQTSSTTVPVVVGASVFNATVLPPLEVRPGAQVKYDLTPFLSRGVDQVRLQDTSWLALDSHTRIISGTAPNSTSSSLVKVLATDPTTHAISQALLNVTVTPTAAIERTGTGKTIKRSIIALVVGALLAFVVLCLLAACCRRFCSADRDDLEAQQQYKDRQKRKTNRFDIDFTWVRPPTDKEKKRQADELFAVRGKRDTEEVSSKSGGWIAVERGIGLTEEEKRARGIVDSPPRGGVAAGASGGLAALVDVPGLGFGTASGGSSVFHRVRSWVSSHRGSAREELRSNADEVVVRMRPSETADTFRALSRQGRHGSIDSDLRDVDIRVRVSPSHGSMSSISPETSRHTRAPAHIPDFDSFLIHSEEPELDQGQEHDSDSSRSSPMRLTRKPPSIPRRRSDFGPKAYPSISVTASPESEVETELVPSPELPLNSTASNSDESFVEPPRPEWQLGNGTAGVVLRGYPTPTSKMTLAEAELQAQATQTKSLNIVRRPVPQTNKSGLGVAGASTESSYYVTATEGHERGFDSSSEEGSPPQHGARGGPSTLSAVTPVLRTAPVMNAGSQPDVRLVQQSSQMSSASVSSAPKLPPLALTTNRTYDIGVPPVPNKTYLLPSDSGAPQATRDSILSYISTQTVDEYNNDDTDAEDPRMTEVRRALTNRHIVQ